MSKKNFTISTVATAPSPTTSGTSLVVATGTGSLFAVNEPAVICPANDSSTNANAEVVMVTNIATDTLTITRTQESSSARDIQVGDVIFQQISAKDWNDLVTLATHTNRDALDDVAGVNTGDDASIPVGYLETDGTLADNSDSKVPTQKAVKTYADTKIAKTTNITALNETGIADGEIAVFNLTNKDIRTSNVVISTDGTLAGNADTNMPTEKAVKTYVDGTKFVWKGEWETSTVYAVRDLVQHEGSAYICAIAHTSGTFATDLSAGKWELFAEGVGGNSLQIDCSGGTSDTYGVLSGLVNSSNTVYTVSLGSYVSGSLRVYLNGQLQTQGSSEDWAETTPASGTFTFATAPTTGDIIIAVYQFTTGATGNADTLDGSHLTDIIDTIYPVGSIYISTVSTNPATLFGRGTWSAFGAGKTLVGLDSGDTDFDTAEETGGVKAVTLTSAQSGVPAHTHPTVGGAGTGGASYRVHDYASTTNTSTGGDSFVPTSANATANASSAHTNLQPYIVTYMWKRTA